jgi:uncharacterized protein DUF3618
MEGDVGQENGQQRDPGSIQKEIEKTRAELAETIDAIADRISPKRAAARSASAVKAQVSSVFGGNGSAPAAVLDAPPGAAGRVDSATRRREVQSVAQTGGGTAYTGTSEYAVSRRLRLDRVLLVTGIVAAAAGVVILWRSRD